MGYALPSTSLSWPGSSGAFGAGPEVSGAGPTTPRASAEAAWAAAEISHGAWFKLGAEEVGFTHGLQSMACRHAQYAVTGAAFHHLPQMSDTPVLETVIHNAVVIARIKPHQKGHIMDMLTVRGLYQMYLCWARYIGKAVTCLWHPLLPCVCFDAESLLPFASNSVVRLRTLAILSCYKDVCLTSVCSTILLC